MRAGVAGLAARTWRVRTIGGAGYSLGNSPPALPIGHQDDNLSLASTDASSQQQQAGGDHGTSSGSGPEVAGFGGINAEATAFQSELGSDCDCGGHVQEAPIGVPGDTVEVQGKMPPPVYDRGWDLWTALGQGGSIPAIPLTPDEELLLTRLVFAEGANQRDVGKAAIAWVVRNRLVAHQKRFGLTVRQIVFKRSQFEAVGRNTSLWARSSNGLAGLKPGEKKAFLDSQRAVESVFGGRAPDPTGGALWYATPVSAASSGFFTKELQRGTMVQTVTIGGHLFFAEP